MSAGNTQRKKLLSIVLVVALLVVGVSAFTLPSIAGPSTAKTVKVTFSVNSEDTEHTLSFAEGGDGKLPVEIIPDDPVTGEGQVFAGWKNKEQDKDKIYSKSDLADVAVTEDTEFEAVFEEKPEPAATEEADKKPDEDTSSKGAVETQTPAPVTSDLPKKQPAPVKANNAPRAVRANDTAALKIPADGTLVLSGTNEYKIYSGADLSGTPTDEGTFVPSLIITGTGTGNIALADDADVTIAYIKNAMTNLHIYGKGKLTATGPATGAAKVIDAKSGTLTVSDATLNLTQSREGAISAKNLVLNGADVTVSSPTKGIAAYVPAGGTVTATDSKLTANGSTGLYLVSSSSTPSTLTAKGTSVLNLTGTGSNGIYGTTTDVVVANSAVIKGHSNAASHGIYVKSLTVSDSGQVTGTAGSKSGVYTSDLVMSGSSVVTGKADGSQGQGITVDTKGTGVSLSGNASLNGVGGTGNNGSGIYVSWGTGQLKLADSAKLNATGGQYGLYSAREINIQGGELMGTATDTTGTDVCGIKAFYTAGPSITAGGNAVVRGISANSSKGEGLQARASIVASGNAKLEGKGSMHGVYAYSWADDNSELGISVSDDAQVIGDGSSNPGIDDNTKMWGVRTNGTMVVTDNAQVTGTSNGIDNRGVDVGKSITVRGYAKVSGTITQVGNSLTKDWGVGVSADKMDIEGSDAVIIGKGAGVNSVGIVAGSWNPIDSTDKRAGTATVSGMGSLTGTGDLIGIQIADGKTSAERGILNASSNSVINGTSTGDSSVLTAGIRGGRIAMSADTSITGTAKADAIHGVGIWTNGISATGGKMEGTGSKLGTNSGNPNAGIVSDKYDGAYAGQLAMSGTSVITGTGGDAGVTCTNGLTVNGATLTGIQLASGSGSKGYIPDGHNGIHAASVDVTNGGTINAIGGCPAIDVTQSLRADQNSKVNATLNTAITHDIYAQAAIRSINVAALGGSTINANLTDKAEGTIGIDIKYGNPAAGIEVRDGGVINVGSADKRFTNAVKSSAAAVNVQGEGSALNAYADITGISATQVDVLENAKVLADTRWFGKDTDSSFGAVVTNITDGKVNVKGGGELKEVYNYDGLEIGKNPVNLSTDNPNLHAVGNYKWTAADGHEVAVRGDGVYAESISNGELIGITATQENDSDTNTIKDGGSHIIIMKAKLSGAVKYQLSFELNGGIGTTPDPQRVEIGTTATAVEAPERAGYTFEGWNTKQDGTGDMWNFAESAMPENDVTLYAQWKLIPPEIVFTVSFVDWNGEILKSEKVKEGADATAPGYPGRDGYTFTGWSRDYNNVRSDIIVVAQYKLNDAPQPTYYNVRFVNYNGDLLKEQRVKEGEDATAPANPRRQGYDFTGWSRGYTNVKANITVTAKYRAHAEDNNPVTNVINNMTGGGGPAGTPPVVANPTYTESNVTPAENNDSVTFPDEEIPSTTIGGNRIPLYGSTVSDSWALTNLILAIGVAVLAIIMAFVTLSKGRREDNMYFEGNQNIYATEDKKAGRLWFVVAAVSAIVGIVIFLLTQDMSNDIVVFDNWTIAHGILTVIGIFSSARIFHAKKGGAVRQA